MHMARNITSKDALTKYFPQKNRNFPKKPTHGYSEQYERRRFCSRLVNVIGAKRVFIISDF